MDIKEVKAPKIECCLPEPVQSGSEGAVLGKVTHHVQHEPTILAHRQRYELIAHQHIGMLVEHVAISAFRFLVHLVMVPLGKGYVNAVFRSRKQGIVYGQQHIKGLRGPGKEKVTSDGNLFDIHLPANI